MAKERRSHPVLAAAGIGALVGGVGVAAGTPFGRRFARPLVRSLQGGKRLKAFQDRVEGGLRRNQSLKARVKAWIKGKDAVRKRALAERRYARARLRVARLNESSPAFRK